MKLNIIVLEAQSHNEQQVLESRGYLFDNLKTFYDLNIIKPDEFSLFIENKDEVCDTSLTVLFVASGGTEETFLNFYPFLKRPFVILSDAHHNSYAAASEICSWLHQNNVRHYKINIPYNPTSDYFSKLKKTIDHIYLQTEYKDKIRGERIGLIGGASSWLIASNIERENIEQEWGVQFIDININEIIEQINLIKSCNIDYTKSPLYREYISKLAKERTSEHLTDALIAYEAINNIVIKYKLNSLTIKCFDIIKLADLTACLALSILNDKGIIAGCEGDIPTLITMMMIHKLHGNSSFMVNPSSTDEDNLTVDFSHCTIPISMVDDFSLPTHFESDKGIAIKGLLPIGNYYLSKIGGVGLDKFFKCTGEIILNPQIPFRCRTQIRFKFNNLEDFNKFISSRLGNHFVISKVN